jgi:hypothetical protein
MTYRQLEINILYYSRTGRETTFTDIKNGKDSMDLEDYVPNCFWMLMGGFQVTIDGYKTIFNSSDFHYLVKAASFLIHSQYWIKGKLSDWFDKDDTFPNDVIVRSTGDNLVRLQKNDVNFLKLSYTPKEPHPYKRGERFFNEEIVEKIQWFQQTDIALSEYFDILLHVVDQNENTETSKTMLDYYAVWKAISDIT